MIPRLFCCSGGQLLEADRGYDDAGEPYELRARTRPALPGGVAGEAEFWAVHLAVTYSTPFNLRVTPVVDGVPLWELQAEVEYTGEPLDRPYNEFFELGLALPIEHEGNVVARTMLHGTSFQLDLGMPCEVEWDGDFFVEGVELEHRVLTVLTG